MSLDEFNNQAFANYKESLAKCENCGRTFNHDRLTIHQRSCTSESPAKAVGNKSKVASGPLNSPLPSPGAAAFGQTGNMMTQNAIRSDRRQISRPPVDVEENEANNVSEPEAEIPMPTGTGSSSEDIPLARGQYAIPTDGMGEMSLNESSGQVSLVPCSLCGRNFAIDRLPKHEEACRRANKKRTPFNVSKMRAEGTDLEGFASKGTARRPGTRSSRSTPQSISSSANASSTSSISASSTASSSKKKKDWRREHSEFQAAIRAAREISAIEKAGGKLSDLPPPPPSENPDYVQCPYCMRRFNETAAERHIPKCKDTIHRPKPPGSSGSGNLPHRRNAPASLRASTPQQSWNSPSSAKATATTTATAVRSSLTGSRAQRMPGTAGPQRTGTASTLTAGRRSVTGMASGTSASQLVSPARFCGNCGSRFAAPAKFCSECGTKR